MTAVPTALPPEHGRSVHLGKGLKEMPLVLQLKQVLESPCHHIGLALQNAGHRCRT